MPELERILYAEDDIDIQQVAILALETVGGFTLNVCNNGVEAIEQIASFQPQLLLFDVMMPDLDGPSALLKIRQKSEYQGIPAIFMTAKIQPQEVQQYLDMGALGVIAKPFNPMSLACQVKDMWQGSQDKND
jgi:two-component system OmpR family response regulator